MERLFLNPENGEVHPESHWVNENIDLACLIEKIEVDGEMGFVIHEGDIDRYRVRCDEVFAIFKMITFNMMKDIANTDDEEKIDLLRRGLVKIATAMLRNMKEQEEENEARLRGLN